MIGPLLSCLLITGLMFGGGLIDMGRGNAAEVGGGQLGTQACDFSAIKDSLHSTESGAQNYGAVNERTEAAGKYQFMPATRNSYIRNHPECGGQNCNTTATWTSAACHQVQECIMDAFTNDNLQAIRRDPACQQLLANGGQTITGSGQRQTLTCQVTESGLLAAFHLGGRDECRKILANGHGDNDGVGGRGGTDTAMYTCRHGGLGVPGDCAPSPANTSEGATATNGTGTGTQAAVDFNGGEIADGPTDPLREWWDAALMLMAEQFTANMTAQVEAIGMMLDAKHQLETQRLFQEKMAEAHKDYQPSEEMCTFGTFARDLAGTERSANISRTVVANHILGRETIHGDTVGLSQLSDSLSRIAKFRTTFCNPIDNGNGLAILCPQAPPAEMMNRDINYTKTIDQPLSLDIDMRDEEATNDETAVFALVDNLFAHNPLEALPAADMNQRRYQYHYQNLRSIVAMRGIARNSIANIIALKTATVNKDAATSNAPYLRALLREFGLQDEEIEKMLGANPSYNAQMEFLTKKIYQNPLFYTNLYDKPTNVKRLRAAMQAVKLMQDRDIHAALQRREMLMSLLLELRLRKRADKVYDDAELAMFSDEVGAAGGGIPGGGAAGGPQQNGGGGGGAIQNFFNLFNPN